MPGTLDEMRKVRLRSYDRKWPVRIQSLFFVSFGLLLINALGAGTYLSGINLKGSFMVWVSSSLLALPVVGWLALAILALLSLGEQDAQSLKRLENFVESFPDAAYGIDLEGLCTYCNRACLRMLGFEEASQLIGSNIHFLVFSGAEERPEACPLLIAMSEGKNLQIPDRIARRTDGVRISVEFQASLIHEGGKVVGAAVNLTDISLAKAARSALKRDRESLEMQLHDLSKHTREVALFGELAEMLQVCSSTQELFKVVSAFARELFPLTPGALYIVDPVRKVMESRISWGEPSPPLTPPFALEDCWSVRRGKPHYREGPREGQFCAHVTGAPPAFTLCIPMSGHGSTLGLLHLRAGEAETEMSDSRQMVAIALAYQAALGLSNLQLKEILHEEAIRDPITGLFNRRFMKESLEHEIQRAQRTGTSVGVIALDLDHFKEANDTLGHAAGDSLLLGLAKLVKSSFRAEDICCRQGGDEFLLILPDCAEVESLARAEHLRADFEELVKRQFPSLGGKLTLSAGLAVYPRDAQAPEGLQKAADLALYGAKAQGRNRIVVSSQSQVPI